VPIKGVLLLVFFAGSLPVCLVRPFYGILLWTVIAFLNPQSSLFYWSVANTFPWAIAVAVPTLIGFALFPKEWKNLKSSKFFFVIVMWVWFTITSFVSTHTPVFVHHAGDTWYRWGYVSKVLLMTMVAAAIINSFERLRILVLVMAGCLGFFVAKSFPFILLTGGSARLYGPEFSMIADNNDFGLALNMTLPLFFYLAQTESRRWVRRLCGVLFVMTIPAIFFTYSRGALTGLIAILGLILLRSRQRLVLFPVIVFGVTVALLFAPAAWKHRMDPTRPDAIDGSARSRLNAWQYSWNLAQDYPVAGGGFGTFTNELFARYAPNIADIHGPHSIYFQVLAEHGFVGLALYLAVISSCFVTVHRLRKRARFYGDKVVLAYTDMFRFSLVGFLTSGLFLGRAYFDYFFSIVACLAVLEKLAQREWAEDAAEASEEMEPEPSGPEVFLPEREAAR
jgi:probable O-glycosylation ligase (exosortase A-associated)